MTTEDFRLPPLTKDNYQRWKYEVRSCLKSIGATGHVDGTVRCPAVPGNEKDAEIWLKTDGKAQRVLTCALSDDDHAAIRDCDTSREVWLKIQSIYETKTNENKYLLNQEFHKLHFNDDQSIASYCAQLTVIRQKLRTLDEELLDSCLVAKLINDLPSRLDNFRSAYYIQAASGTNLTFDKLKEQLLLIETNISSTNVKTDTGDALVAQSKEKSSKYPKKSDKRTCFHCKKVGHIKRECRKWKAEQSKEQSTASVASGQAFISTNEESKETKQNEWLADSGATHHMTHRREWLYDFEPIEKGQFGVRIGDNHVIDALGRGKIDVIATINDKKVQHKLCNVLFVPDLRKNLLSIGAAADNNIEARLSKTNIKLMFNNNAIAYGTRISDGFYSMNFKTIVNASANVSSATANEQVWHERFGHANYKVIQQLANSSAVDGMQMTIKSNANKEDRFCETCVFGKQCRKTFNTSDNRADKPGTLIHFDICGPMSTESFGGARYMALFVDDYTGMIFVYTRKSKADIVNHMKDIITEANAAGHKIRRVRSDNAKKFIGQDMKKILRNYSILHEVSTPYCPEQNGRAERQNRTIVEMARTMLAGAELPQGLWGEAVHTAAYIRYHIPLDRLNGKTPIELWTGTKPTNVSNLRIIGSKAFTLINEKKSKFEKKSQELVLVGYAPKQKAYRVWYRGTRKVIVSRDVIIVEPETKRQAVIVETVNDNQDETSHDFKNNEMTKSIDKVKTQINNEEKKNDDDNCIANRTCSKYKSNMTTARIALLADVIIPITVTEAKFGSGSAGDINEE